MNKNNSHMKTLTRIFTGLAVLAAAVSCQMYEVDTQMTPEKARASIRMECSAVDVYTLAAQNPESITFNVSSNTPWTLTLSSGADWLTVTPSSSASSALITDVVVSAKTNTSTVDRQATLTLKGDNIANAKIITIKQARAGKLFVTPMANDYAIAGGPLSFTIQTNLAWEVHSNSGWLTFNRESGEPDPEGRSLTIIATAAPSDVLERTATVTVIAGDQQESFDVVQKGNFLMNAVSGVFDASGESKPFTIKSDLPWSLSADKDWLSFDMTEGEGGGVLQKVIATAAANFGLLRTATVTVLVGGAEKTFGVSQSGFTFEIVAPESNELPRLGGEMVLNVNTTLSWDPVTEVPGWSVEKIDASSFKVKADFNNIFMPKTGKVGIVSGDLSAEVELTQAINFSFENAEVQSDGSVKIFGNQKSRVSLLDQVRYVSFVLEMGKAEFDDKAEFVCSTHDANTSEMQCQIRLGAGKNRLRTNGGPTGYNTKDIGITKAELNAMTEYRMDFRPNADNPANIDLEFFYNGTSKAALSCPSPYVGNDIKATYFFGIEDVVDGNTSWFIVKSCTPTFFAE